MARFKLHGKTYTTSALDEITLKDLVLFNTQAEATGITRKWSDVERVSAELSQLTPAEADRHPEKFLAIAVTIWASRRTSGEDITFDEAIDFPIKDIEFLPEPEDRKPGKRQGAKKAPKKRSTRTSGPADEPPAEGLAHSST